MPKPAYDILLVAHVAAAFVGFGSIAIAGWAAAVGRSSSDPATDERVTRFFRPGVDWPGRVIFLVPLLGLTMLFGGDHPDIAKAWPWAGLALWTVTAGVATARLWPAEQRAQGELVAIRDGDSSRAGLFRTACGEMERSAALVSICFVVAVALMIWQP